MAIVPRAMAVAQRWLPLASAPDSERSIAVVNRRDRAASAKLPPDAVIAVGMRDRAGIVFYEPVSSPLVPAAIAPIGEAMAETDFDRDVQLVITKVGGAAALRETPAWPYLKPLAIPEPTELAALNQHQPDFAAYLTIEAPPHDRHRQPERGLGATRHCRLPPPRLTPARCKVVREGQGHLAQTDALALLADVIGAALTASAANTC